MFTQKRKEKERALIAGDASAEAVTALIFMALNVNRKASHATDISPGFDDRHGRGH
jgi:hypothetical protein